MTTRRPTTPADRRIVTRTARALVLVCLAVAAQASGQALPSPSPSPPEPTSKFRVLQAPRSVVDVNEVVDLGTLRIRETATYDFLLASVRPRISGDPGDPLQIGLSVDSTAVQLLPSEVTVPRSGRAPFEIKVNARWLAVGTHVFEVVASDLNDPGAERPFRIQVTVLDDATIQDAIRGIYERYRQYTVGSGKSATIELSQFDTFARGKLAEFGALDFITMHGGQTLEYEFNYLRSSQEGERIVTSPYWRDAGDYSQTNWWKKASTETFLEAIEHDPVLEPHTRATRYRVDVSADGLSRAYTAVVLWGGGAHLQFLDYIVPGVTDVAGFESQPGLSATLLADTIAERAGGGAPPTLAAAEASRSTPRSVAGAAGVRQCEPWEDDAGQGLFWNTDHFGHLTGAHGSRGTITRECSCTEDCVSECKVMEAVNASCYESGDTDLVHQRGFKFRPVPGYSATGPAQCAAAIHCAIRACQQAHCGGFDVTIGVQGSQGGQGGASGNIGFEYSHVPSTTPLIIYDYEQQYPGENDTACPACIELFPIALQVKAEDPSDNPFVDGVRVDLSVGDGVDYWEGFNTFNQPDNHFLFGHFKQGLTYGISYTALDPANVCCELSGGNTIDTIGGPLTLTLTCSRTTAGLSGRAATGTEAGSGQCGGGGGGGGSHLVKVNARATCPGCPPDIEPPPMPSLSATLSASPQPPQTITIDGEFTHIFPNPLPDGTPFGVDFSSPGDHRWSCTDQASGRIVGGPAEVILTCTFSPPFSVDCNLNPDACDGPPINCGWVWKPFVDVPIREVWTESYDVPGGEVLIIHDVTTWQTIYWRTIECTGSATGAGLAGSSGVVRSESAGSTNTDSAPLVILRNSAQHEFPGPSVPIMGVARDDTSNVTGIQVYVDGQQVSLSELEINQVDLDTCDEIPELVPGRPCNFHSAFSGNLDVSGIGPGTHHISISATNADGVVGFTEKYLTIAEPEPNDPNALEVTDHPDNASVFVGEGTSWSVTATGGVPPYSYTWEAMGPQATVFEPVGNCCNTSGSSTRTLVLHYAEAHYDGSRVRCRIQDSAGHTVVSNSAYLWTRAPLQIAAHPEDVSVSPGEDATFSVDVFGGEPPYSYQWHAIIPAAPGTAVELEGEVAPTLTVDSVGSGMHGVRYLCRVTDSEGQTVFSHTALLLVE